ncbi:MAG: response regulator [Blastocatellia bacterium]
MGYKILLADDSVTVQKIITLTFSDEGVDVITVNNGDEALHRLQYLRPALVMADVSIPGRNGYEICEFVKIHPEMRDTPVILLVPAFEPFDEERARRIGADYHLTKPFQSIRTLISTVKNLVERKADAELTVKGSGLTAVRGSDQNNSVTVEVDSKRAKIEQLLRLSTQAPLENVTQDDVLLEVDLKPGDGRYPGSLAVASASEVVEVIEDSRVEAIEVPLARAAQGTDGAAQELRVPTEIPDLNMDDILELEDVLPEAGASQIFAVDESAATQPAHSASAEASENQRAMVIPQSAIDEIVNRVSAQLSEKLSGEIARRIAPEVADLVKRQLLAEPAVYRNSDNLLDLD